MRTPIVVPLDWSAFAERALAPAAALARPLGGSIELVMVSSPGVDPNDDGRYLARLAAEVEGPAASWTLLEGNDVGAALREHLARRPDGLVCMATHGRGGIARAVLGSTAEAVVRHSDRPVLLVGPSSRVDEETKIVLACVDPTAEASRRAVEPALALASELGATTWLLEVQPPGTEAARDGDVVEGADLAGLAADARRRAAEVEWLVEHEAEPSRGILEAAASVHAGVIVMMTRARRGLARSVLGSVTERVVRHAPCPVLVVPPAS